MKIVCKSRQKYSNKISEEKEITESSCSKIFLPKQIIRKLSIIPLHIQTGNGWRNLNCNLRQTLY